jgi:hypothetical protein
MAWVWHWSMYPDVPEANIDYKASAPIYSSIGFHDFGNFPSKKVPLFKTRGKLDKFVNLHCPPIGTDPVVDDLWQSIIRRFAGPKHVGFLPIQLNGRNGTTRKFSWVVCFDEVECIDAKKSKIRWQNKRSKIVDEIDEFVHVNGCLGELHIARDKLDAKHIVISEELHDALADTGESAMFFRPKDVPTFYGKNSFFGIERN